MLIFEEGVSFYHKQRKYQAPRTVEQSRLLDIDFSDLQSVVKIAPTRQTAPTQALVARSTSIATEFGSLELYTKNKMIHYLVPKPNYADRLFQTLNYAWKLCLGKPQKKPSTQPKIPNQLPTTPSTAQPPKPLSQQQQKPVTAVEQKQQAEFQEQQLQQQKAREETLRQQQLKLQQDQQKEAQEKAKQQALQQQQMQSKQQQHEQAVKQKTLLAQQQFRAAKEAELAGVRSQISQFENHKKNAQATIDSLANSTDPERVKKADAQRRMIDNLDNALLAFRKNEQILEATLAKN
eukprot:TRINITY_DN12794_c0_g1_i1.p1 TRINITY_DN12794_c0_g1~~TRINITY_DN12794_c0_g1_i1.p1  ORF type:complete len:293 (+),score=84.80 TRINITY_DN12794_c0_g1_i1:107-985(+)